MKKIRFRAWDKENESWVDESVWELHLDLSGKLWGKFHNEGWADVSELFDLVEFTGLKDKKGVEIYEGDIVKDNPKSPNWEVFWGEKYGWTIRAKNIYDPTTKHRIYRKFDWLAIRKQVEVIGNIYEDKDLLTK